MPCEVEQADANYGRRADRVSERHHFAELPEGFAPERRERIGAMKRVLLAQMPLQQLRQARDLAQRDIAITNLSQAGEAEEA